MNSHSFLGGSFFFSVAETTEGVNFAVGVNALK